MADTSAAGQLTAAWDGVTPATAPAGSIVLLAPGRDATVGIDVRGTFVATITLETSVDGLNWSAPSVTTLAGAASTATFTTPGSRLVVVGGAALLRARCSAYTSGTATVVMVGTPSDGGSIGSGVISQLASLILTQSAADTIALASAARTTTQNIDIINNNLSRMLLTIDVTAGSGGGITPSVKFKDPASGKFVTLHAALTKITGTGTYTYAVGMGSPTAVGGITAVIPFSLPATARITLTVDDATSYTYSVGYCQMP